MGPKMKLKFVLGWFWFLAVLFCTVFLILQPQWLNPDFLKEILSSYQTNIVFVYCSILLIRIFFFIPPTPLLFLGFALFPTSKIMVALIVLMSNCISATFYYYFAGTMGWNAYFQRKFPSQMQKLEAQLVGKKSLFLMSFWCFFPLIPTDLVCYVAAVVGLKYSTVISGVLIGQIPMLILYTWLGEIVFNF